MSTEAAEKQESQERQHQNAVEAATGDELLEEANRHVEDSSVKKTEQGTVG